MRDPNEKIVRFLNGKFNEEEELNIALVSLLKLPVDDQIILMAYISKKAVKLVETKLFTKWCNLRGASVDEMPIKTVSEI